MTSNTAFSDGVALINSYTNSGYKIVGKTNWTAVPALTTGSGSFQLYGGFALAKNSTTNTNLMLTIVDLDFRNVPSITSSNVL